MAPFTIVVPRYPIAKKISSSSGVRPSRFRGEEKARNSRAILSRFSSICACWRKASNDGCFSAGNGPTRSVPPWTGSDFLLMMSDDHIPLALSSVRAKHPIAQHADPFDLKFDDVAVLQPSVEFQAAASSYGPGAEEFSGTKRLSARHIRDHLLEGVQHSAAVGIGPRLAIDRRAHGEVIRIWNLVGRHNPGPKHVSRVEALSLCGAEHPLHLLELRIACREIVV